jgi:putative ABC transport system permease protein
MQMYNRESIHRMMVEAVSDDAMVRAERAIIETIKDRHAGHDDVTVLNQGAILATFNTIFLVLTTSLAGIAMISLLVAGTLIMNVMLVAVSQRTEEIGLIKALGASRGQIITLFLTEAAILSLLGAFVGVLVGQIVISIARQVYPVVDFQAPDWAVIAAVLMAVGSGLLFGIMPARRAAALDPVEALAGR